MAIQKKTSSSFISTIFRTVEEQSKPLCVLFSCILVLMIMCFAYKWWTVKREREAQYDFSVLMTEYETISHEKNPEWSELLKKFEKKYEKHSSSSLLPYYLNYKVQILLHQDKRDEALVLLDKIVGEVRHSPLIFLYQMEQALLQLDSPEAEVKNKGLNVLIDLAHNSDNQYRDSAQFYLGRYYWTMNDIEGARNIWQQLVDEQRDEKLAPSPWAYYVQDKLNTVIV